MLSFFTPFVKELYIRFHLNHLTIYPNGTVRVFIQPMKRDSISYSGKLE